MSQMEIDLITTPSSRSVGQKRPRSPASPSSLDRPSKRASGSAGGSPSLLDFQQQKAPNTNSIPHHLRSTYLECKTPDDWVVKTGGLKLDSPSFGLVHVPLPASEPWNVDATAENADKAAREVMMTDRDSSMTMDAWPFLSNENNGPSAFYASDTTHTSFPSPQPLPAHPAASALHRSDTHMHVQPCALSGRGLAHSDMIQSSPMSATNSSAWPSAGIPVTKARITMGPRPDCEKCRMGVKGHWMHID